MFFENELSDFVLHPSSGPLDIGDEHDDEGEGTPDPPTDLDFEDIENVLQLTPLEVIKPAGSAPSTNHRQGNAHSLSALAKDLKDLGLPLDIKEEDSITDSSDFLTKIKSAITTLADNKMQEQFKNFSPAKKIFLEIEAGVDDQVQAIRVAQTHAYLKGISDESVSTNDGVAKDLAKRYYGMKGMSAAEVTEQIEMLETQNKLADKAKLFLPELIQYTQTYIDQAKANAATNANPDNDPFITGVNGFLSDEKKIPFSISKEIRDAAIKSLRTPVKVIDTGEALNSVAYKQYKNAEGFEGLMQVYDQLGLFDMKEDGTFVPNIKKLSKLVSKQVTSNLDKVISKGQRLENMTNGFESVEEASVEDNMSVFRKMAKALNSRALIED